MFPSTHIAGGRKGQLTRRWGDGAALSHGLVGQMLQLMRVDWEVWLMGVVAWHGLPPKLGIRSWLHVHHSCLSDEFCNKCQQCVLFRHLCQNLRILVRSKKFGDEISQEPFFCNNNNILGLQVTNFKLRNVHWRWDALTQVHTWTKMAQE